VLDQVKTDPTTFSQYQSVEATLKFATAAFMTQGGFFAFKGELPELVEVAVGRIRRFDNVNYTTIDEPFVFRAADNFFQKTDPRYFYHHTAMLAASTSESSCGKYWEAVLPTNLEGIFHNRVVPMELFNGAEPPHEMFLHKAEIVGCTGGMQSTNHTNLSMQEFLEAHFKHNSEHKGHLVPPFFFPYEQESGPDIVFVVRSIGVNTDATTGSPDIKCPVFVQAKLCKSLGRSDAEKARGTVQPTKIEKHGIDISEYCKPHNHYISLIVSYPAEVTKYFKDNPITMKHEKDINEIALTIDENNIHKVFAKEYVAVLDQVRRFADEMAKGIKRVKRART
jgi:hypothetical protein